MKEMTIYFTSDTHGYILDTNYQNDTKMPVGILQAAAQFQKDGNTLILDGGDTIQGSPLAKYCSDRQDTLISEVLNRCSYDYVTLGNHDFNYGYDMLDAYLSSLDAGCICANVVDKTGHLDIRPYVIKQLENGMKVGIVGIVTDYVPVWEVPEHLENIEIKDSFECAKKYLLEIKEQCDITICLYHGGFEANLQSGEILLETNENVGYRICQELDFNVLLTSHQHMPTEFQNVNNTYVIQNAPNASTYAKIVVKECDGELTFSGALEKTPLCDIEVFEKLQATNETLVKSLDVEIGHLSKPMELQSKIQSAIEGAPLANLCNKIQLEYSGADIACTSLSNECIVFDQDVTIRNVMAAYPFPNTIVVLEVNKAQIMQVLNRASEYFDIDDEEIVVSKRFLEPKIEHFNYDFFMGIEYTFNVSKPLGQRVENVLFKGKPLSDEVIYTLAMNNYRSTGTGGYDCYKECKVVREYGVDIQEVIIDYIVENKEIELPSKTGCTVKVG